MATMGGWAFGVGTRTVHYFRGRGPSMCGRIDWPVGALIGLDQHQGVRACRSCERAVDESIRRTLEGLGK